MFQDDGDVNLCEKVWLPQMMMGNFGFRMAEEL